MPAKEWRSRKPGEPSVEAPTPLLQTQKPHNIEAEEGLLGACLLDGGKEVMTMCMEQKLTPEAFYREAHQIIFQIMMEFYEEGQNFDEIMLIDRLQSRTVSSLKNRYVAHDDRRTLFQFIGEDETIARLTNRIETRVFASQHLKVVKEKYLLRRMIDTAANVVDRCYHQQDRLDNFIEQVEQELFSISQDRVSDTAKPVRLAVENAEVLINKMIQSKGELSGVSSGFTELDNLTFGFQPGDMIVLAARPSMGKTALALNFAEAAFLPRHGRSIRTLMFSLEMNAESLAMRMICSRARVPSEKVRKGFVNPEMIQQLVTAARELKSAPFLIDDSNNLSILELRAKARRLNSSREKERLGLIIIDYLQLINPVDNSVPREQQVAEISRGIKAMAKELNVPVIVLCQLNRDSEKEKRAPRMSDLRESGSIEQDADLVLMLYSKADKERDGDPIPQAGQTRNLMIAKQRNGPVGEIRLTFLKEFSRFENYAEIK